MTYSSMHDSALNPKALGDTPVPAPSVASTATIQGVACLDTRDTLFSLVDREGHFLQFVSSSYYKFVHDRESFPKDVLPAHRLSVGLIQFHNLAKSIQKERGDVTSFAADPGCTELWGSWLRTRAADVVQRLLQGDIRLPRMGDAPAPSLSSESQELSMEALYRYFFLDQALPHYTHLYSRDLRGETLTLSLHEKVFLRELSYYDFVALITYLGSLLLQASHRYCRILYEGLRLMLIRSYYVLGIIPWYPFADDIEGVKPWVKSFKYFKGELPANLRLNLMFNPGDSYAQHGWELFKCRPYALWFLASITQIALFKETLQHEKMCSDLDVKHEEGVVVYVTSTTATSILGTSAREKDIPTFCKSRKVKMFSFYNCPPEAVTFSALTHEWYILADICYLYTSDQEHQNSIQQAQQTKIDNSLILMEAKLRGESPSPEAKEHIKNTLTFPTLAQFGITPLKKDGIDGFRFNFAQYLRTRYLVSLNKIIYYSIPTRIEQRLDTGTLNCSLDFRDRAEELVRPTSEILAEVEHVTNKYNKIVMEAETQFEPNSLDYHAKMYEAMPVLKRLTFLTSQKHTVIELNSMLSSEVQEQLKVHIFEAVLKPTVVDEAKRVFISRDNLLKFLHLIQTKAMGLHPYLFHAGPVKMEEENNTKFGSIAPQKPKALVRVERSTNPHLGRRPNVMFFSLESCIPEPITLFVTTVRGKYFIGFPPHLSKPIAKEFEVDSAPASAFHTYTFYPNYLFVAKSLATDKRVFSVIKGWLKDSNKFLTLIDKISSEFDSIAVFKECIRSKVTPEWMYFYLGASSAEEYLAKYSDGYISTDVQLLLRDVHAVYGNPNNELKSRQYEYQRVELLRKKKEKKLLNAQLQFQNKENTPTVKYLIPFTPDEDVVIKALYSPSLDENAKQELIAKCSSRTWKSIQMRARYIAKIMLEKDKIFDISLLPIQNYTAKIKKQLAANFEAALNVDPRLKVDEDKNTVEALKARYLTLKPRRRN